MKINNNTLWIRKKYSLITIITICLMIISIICIRYNLKAFCAYFSSSPYEFVTEWYCKTHDDGPFDTPGRLTADTKGYIYIAYTTGYPTDNFTHIKKFDSSGNFIERWPGQVIRCTDICADSHNHIYMAESGYIASHYARILKFDDKGKLLSVISEKEKKLFPSFRYYQIAVDKEENIFLTQDGNRLQKFDSKGNFIISWEARKYPGEIKLDSKGNVYVVSSDVYDHNKRDVVRSEDLNEDICYDVDNPPGSHDTWDFYINKFDSSGRVLCKDLYKETNKKFDIGEIALDSYDNFFIAGFNNDHILMYDNNGKFIGKFRSKGSEKKGQFRYRDITVDKENNVYVLVNHYIQKFSPKNSMRAHQ